MSSIFTEDLDKARIDLNEAERRAFKAEHAQKEAERGRRQELERAEGLQRRLSDVLAQSDKDHKQVVQLRQQLDRLEGLEPELVQARSDLRDANDRANRYLDQNEGLEVKLKEMTDLLNEKKAEAQMLASELQPTRMLLGSLRVYLQAQQDMRSELERLGW